VSPSLLGPSILINKLGRNTPIRFTSCDVLCKVARHASLRKYDKLFFVNGFVRTSI
jgi:hypothetical protein